MTDLRLRGIDVTPGMIDLASRRLADAGSERDARAGDILDRSTYGESGEAFDLVFCFDVVQQLPRRIQFAALEALCSAIAPGGVATIFDHDRETRYGRTMGLKKWLTRHGPYPFVPRWYIHAAYPPSLVSLRPSSGPVRRDDRGRSRHAAPRADRERARAGDTRKAARSRIRAARRGTVGAVRPSSSGILLDSVTADRPLHLAFLAAPNEGLAREWMAWFADRGHRVGLIVRARGGRRGGSPPRHRASSACGHTEGWSSGRMSSIDARRAIRRDAPQVEPGHPPCPRPHHRVRMAGARLGPSSVRPDAMGHGPLPIRPGVAGAPDPHPARPPPRRPGHRQFGPTWRPLPWVLGARPSDRVRVVKFGIEPAVFQRRPGARRQVEASLGLEVAASYSPLARSSRSTIRRRSFARCRCCRRTSSVLMSSRAAIAPTLGDLLALADDLGVRERLVIVPAIPHDEMPRYLALADVLVTVPHSDARRSRSSRRWPRAARRRQRSSEPARVACGHVARSASCRSATRTRSRRPSPPSLALGTDTLRRRTAEARRVVIERAERGREMRPNGRRHYRGLAAQPRRRSPMTREIIIEPKASYRHYWRDLWDYRELFAFLAWRDISVRYRQTVIGVAWSIIRPVLTMIVFSVVFGGIAKLPAPSGVAVPAPRLLGTSALAVLLERPSRIEPEPDREREHDPEDLLPAAGPADQLDHRDVRGSAALAGGPRGADDLVPGSGRRGDSSPSSR